MIDFFFPEFRRITRRLDRIERKVDALINAALAENQAKINEIFSKVSLGSAKLDAADPGGFPEKHKGT